MSGAGTDQHDGVREQVRAHYAAAARAVTGGEASCCGQGPLDVSFGASRYGKADHDQLSAAAVAASLGCGNPIMVAELAPGETVVDLGSGGGIDVILSARRVGPAGGAYGVDMTDEMVELARANAARAGVHNVEFLHGHIEDVPLPDASVDVVSPTASSTCRPTSPRCSRKSLACCAPAVGSG